MHWRLLVVILGFSASTGALDLRLTVLDVGEGQAVLLQHGTSATLVDTGHAGQVKRVLQALTANGIQRLDRIILTHIHPDHASGYFRIREAYPATPVLDVQVPLSSDVSPDMVRWVNEALSADPLRRRLTAGDTFSWGDVRFNVLWPVGFTSTDLNYHSLVLHIRHGDRSALLMGDAGIKVETQLLYREEPLDADVLVVGHHGSADSGGVAFLGAVRPAYSVISVNSGNLRGYPDNGTLARLSQVSGQVLRTDQLGDICLRLPAIEPVSLCSAALLQ